MHPTPLMPRHRDAPFSLLLTGVERLVDAASGPPPRLRDPRRIIVLRSCCLGDTVLATPLLGVLRRQYPHARIVVGVGAWSRPVVAHSPAVDGLLDLEGVGVGLPSAAAYARVVRRLRAGRFDAALVLDRTPFMTLLPLLAGIPVRAGIDSAGRGFPLNVRAPWTQVEHEADLFLRVGAALGLDINGARLHVGVAPAERARADALWSALGLDDKDVLALAPGGGRNPGMTLQAKHWAPERYAALAARLYHERGLIPLLTGDVHDHDATDHVAHLLHRADIPVADATGFTTIGDLAALYGRCTVFVGADSGPTHLAAAMGIPVIAVFGPTDPAVYAPYSPLAVALRGPSGVSTDEVSVDRVAAAASSLLDGPSHREDAAAPDR